MNLWGALVGFSLFFVLFFVDVAGATVIFTAILGGALVVSD